MDFEKKYILNEYQRQELLKILIKRKNNLYQQNKFKKYGLNTSQNVELCQILILIDIFK